MTVNFFYYVLPLLIVAGAWIAVGIHGYSVRAPKVTEVSRDERGAKSDEKPSYEAATPEAQDDLGFAETWTSVHAATLHEDLERVRKAALAINTEVGAAAWDVDTFPRHAGGGRHMTVSIPTLRTYGAVSLTPAPPKTERVAPKPATENT